ncbi:MAG: hypothetical protein ACYCXW_16490 [Solirubrobacteraceae bacterium]
MVELPVVVDELVVLDPVVLVPVLLVPVLLVPVVLVPELLVLAGDVPVPEVVVPELLLVVVDDELVVAPGEAVDVELVVVLDESCERRSKGEVELEVEVVDALVVPGASASADGSAIAQVPASATAASVPARASLRRCLTADLLRESSSRCALKADSPAACAFT